MIVALSLTWSLDGWIIVVGSLCAVAVRVVGELSGAAEDEHAG